MQYTKKLSDFEKELSEVFEYHKFTDYIDFLKFNWRFPFDESKLDPEVDRRIEGLTEGNVFDKFFYAIYVFLSSKKEDVLVNVIDLHGDTWYGAWKYNYVVVGSQDGIHVTQHEFIGVPESKGFRAFNRAFCESAYVLEPNERHN